jgi:hypothetical protein
VGYLDLYNLQTGALAKGQFKDSKGQIINADVYIGGGPAYTPNISVTASGLSVFLGSQASLTPPQPITANSFLTNRVIQWRVH